MSNCLNNGINVDSCNDCNITNNKIDSCSLDNLYIYNSDYIIVKGNISLNATGENTLRLSTNCLFASNIIKGCGAGLYIVDTTDSTIIENTISSNTGLGVDLDPSGTNNIIANNIILNNGNYGIHVKGEKNIIINNMIYNNGAKDIYLTNQNNVLYNNFGTLTISFDTIPLNLSYGATWYIPSNHTKKVVLPPNGSFSGTDKIYGDGSMIGFSL